MSWTSARARVAALSRSRSTTDPDLISARLAMAEFALERQSSQIAKRIIHALQPIAPLTKAQASKLNELLEECGVGGDH